jgi:hypothetical protein
VITDVVAYDSKGGVIGLTPGSITMTIGGIAVWPGDTNNDGIVNEHDILPIGIYWLLKGSKRDVVDTEFKPQTAKPWTPVAATYADADGNGIVDAREILVIGRNWGATHTVTTTQQQAPRLNIFNPSIDHSQYLKAYKAMYELLEGQNTEPAKRLKATLEQLIEKASKPLIPSQSELLQNYPNPFNPETWIPYTLSKKAHVIVKIYNISGQLVRVLDLGEQEAGMYVSKEKAAYWDGKNDEGEDVASGVYFYQIHAGDYVSTKRMVVIK